jgi:hypothetical protein
MRSPASVINLNLTSVKLRRNQVNYFYTIFVVVIRATKGE